MKSFIAESILDKARPGWRRRMAKKRSPWNFFCGLLGIAVGTVTYYQLVQGAWLLHLHFYPEHHVFGDSFLGSGQDRPVTFTSALMIVPLFIPAYVFGFIAGNCIAWCIPLARRVMDKEAAGDRTMSFGGSNAELLKYGGLASVVCLLISLIGILAMKTIK